MNQNQHSKIISAKQRCEHCGNWTDGTKAFCSRCGEILDLDYRKEQHHLSRKFKNFNGLMNWVKLPQSQSNKAVWFIEKIIQSGQLVLMTIMALVTLILFLLPG
ncbi:MAG: hypothetical protein MUE96_12700 [Bacteroidia bacterium]|nr:hypothetical protein [Bacteroidia bacterium]